jgi:hypothetical protein
VGMSASKTGVTLLALTVALALLCLGIAIGFSQGFDLFSGGSSLVSGPFPYLIGLAALGLMVVSIAQARQHLTLSAHLHPSDQAQGERAHSLTRGSGAGVPRVAGRQSLPRGDHHRGPRAHPRSHPRPRPQLPTARRPLACPQCLATGVHDVVRHDRSGKGGIRTLEGVSHPLPA